MGKKRDNLTGELNLYALLVVTMVVVIIVSVVDSLTKER
jgi:hypothetical protein